VYLQNKLSDKETVWGKKETENVFSFLFFRATNVTLPTTQR
jgi:hypothetical protein